jgi:hypothetical protein
MVNVEGVDLVVWVGQTSSQRMVCHYNWRDGEGIARM